MLHEEIHPQKQKNMKAKNITNPIIVACEDQKYPKEQKHP